MQVVRVQALQVLRLLRVLLVKLKVILLLVAQRLLKRRQVLFRESCLHHGQVAIVLSHLYKLLGRLVISDYVLKHLYVACLCLILF